MIRSALTADVPRLADIWHDAWHAGHAGLAPTGLTAQRTRENFLPRLERLAAHGDLLVWGDPPVAFVAMADDELYQLMAAPEARGTGVAARLAQAAVQLIGAAGYETAWLHCAVGNERARRFYEREGWRIAREEQVALPTAAGPFTIACWRMEIAT